MNAAVEHLETPEQAARRVADKPLRDGFQPVALHCYRDTEGRALYWRIRLKHPDGRKWIRPLWNDGGGFALVEPPPPPAGKPLYGLQHLAADPDAPVWVVEGESCADALHGLGVPAVTSGGSSSAGSSDWSPLKGRSIIVWPDHDEAGLRYAAEVGTALRALGCTVRIVAREVIEALPEHGDVVDWLAANPAADAEALAAIPTEAAADPHDSDMPARQVKLIDAASVKPEPIRWLWPGWLARGKLHILAGRPGTGKTTIALNLAACITAGQPLPSGWKPQQGNVLVWSGEDDPTDTIIPRLLAAGADLERVKIVGDVQDSDGQAVPFDPARDVQALAAAMRGMQDVALILVDPIVSAVVGDSHKNAEVRRGLAPLADLAMRHGAALVGITHFSKGTTGREPLERVTGSLAFGALARIVMGTVKQEVETDQPATMVLARAKSNIGPDGGGFGYAFEQVELVEHAGIMASRIAWGAEVEGTARELLAEQDPGDDHSESGECADWLREELKDGGRNARDMQREAGKLGFSRKVLRRAREKLGIKPSKADFNKGWVWELPVEDAHETPKMPTPENGHLRQSVGTFADHSEVFEL